MTDSRQDKRLETIIGVYAPHRRDRGRGDRSRRRRILPHRERLHARRLPHLPPGDETRPRSLRHHAKRSGPQQPRHHSTRSAGPDRHAHRPRDPFGGRLRSWSGTSSTWSSPRSCWWSFCTVSCSKGHSSPARAEAYGMSNSCCCAVRNRRLTRAAGLSAASAGLSVDGLSVHGGGQLSSKGPGDQLLVERPAGQRGTPILMPSGSLSSDQLEGDVSARVLHHGQVDPEHRQRLQVAGYRKSA